MKHVRIATYELKDGSFQELADIARTGMLKTFQEQPGVHPVRDRRPR